MEVIIQPCLLCDSPVALNKDSWVGLEAPLAVCDDCIPPVRAGVIPWPMVKMIYVLRCQVADLYQKNAILEAQMKQLVPAQPAPVLRSVG